MSKNNVRIAIRDSTDSHNVAFFDNKAGIKYKSANLHRFLAGSASILTIKYNSKDIDSIRSGCKLSFRYKARDYWLNVMSFEKKGFEAELTAYSLGLELNNETRGEHKPANAMSIAEYVGYYDPEHALTIGVNEVSDKRIKLEWTGTDTILARLFSVANSFGAEIDFSVELNDDYSLKRQVLNIYKKGNLGTNKVSQPVRVGKELKVINYSDNIKELRTAVRATGKDGLTIDGLDKKIYDNNKELLYYSSGMTVYAPQSRDRFPSVGKGSNDNWIVEDLGETQYETKEALWGYMYGEIQKKSLPEITYEVEGAIEAGIGDTQTLIDDIHFEPALYVQARVSELEDDILTGKVTKSTFINFERKYSQIADILLKQVEALAEDAAPYIIRLSTNNGYIFKNGEGSSTITAKLEKYSKIVNAKWKWLINNSVVSETSSVKINASQVNGTLNVVAVAIVGGSEAAREYITFTNVNDGLQGPQGPQGDEGPQGPQGDEGPKGDKGDTGNGIANTVVTYGLSVSDTTEPATWSSSVPTLVKGMYLWTRTVIIYTNGESTTSYQISYIAKDADATAAIDKTKQELLEKLDTVRNDSLAAVEEAKQELTTVANDLGTAKQDLQTQASQLQAQANAQSELTKRVSSVEETANGTKTTVSELSKTVAQNGKDITSVTARTKVVEDDLTSTKTTLSQVQTTADGASSKAATLETGLNGVKADLAATTVTADTTKTNLANYQASNDRAVANLQSNMQTANGNISSLKTKVEAVPGQITSAVSAVESKIPTEIGTVNLVKGTGSSFVMGYGITNTTWNETKKQSILDFSAPGVRRDIGSEILPQENKFFDFIPIKGTTYTQSIMIDTDATFNPNGQAQCSWFTSSGHNQQKAYIKKVGEHSYQVWSTYTWNLENKALRAFDWYGLHNILLFRTTGTYLAFYKPKLTIGNLPSDWSPSPQDYDDVITQVKSEIKQTADGITLLATKTELNAAKNELQSGIKTATDKANNNAQTITTHTSQISALNTGLQAKVSQSDFNTLSGRVTTAENNITAKANELSSKITSVEGKIPTSVGGRNLWIQSKVTGSFVEETLPDNHITGQKKCYRISNNNELSFNIEPDFSSRLYRKVTFSAWVKYDNVVQGSNNWNMFNCFKHSLIYKNSSTGVTSSTNYLTLEGFTGTSDWKRITYTYDYSANKSYNQLKTSIRFNLESARSGTAWVTGVKVEIGSIPSDYSPSPEDYDDALTRVSSEFKQTTDSIKASVTSLNNSTVKSSSLTINSDGIVMKAGKSTTDVANAIGSYFAVNQNAINLFADKIKVKGSMIVSGSISSDKIAASGITANVIKGGTLQSTNGSTNFELNTGKLFYNNNNTGVFRVQNGASTMGLKFSNTPVTVSGTSRILSRVIIGGDRNETSLDDGKWDKGGFSGLVIETIKGAIPAINEHADSLRAISDTIYFTHTYSADSPTGISAHGWKMETYAPDSSYSGNIVLKPYGINYRQSDIVVGDIRLDNGDGSGYWVRATINTLKACFGHILNGGTSSQALNAIRSELNKISGT